MEFSVQITGLSELVAKLQQAPDIVAPIIQRALSASQAILAKYTVKGVVPWRTGFLVQSFRADLTPFMLRWFPTASYAPFVELGTRPHTIVPRNAKALYWPGADHPVRKVNHPGSKPNQFMERIIANAQGDIDAMFGKALEQITAALA